jgi:hypothetical protein
MSNRICGRLPIATLEAFNTGVSTPGGGAPTQYVSFTVASSNVVWMTASATAGITINKTVTYMNIIARLGFPDGAADFDVLMQVLRNGDEELIRVSKRCITTASLGAICVASKRVQIYAGDILTLMGWHNHTSNVTPGGTSNEAILTCILPDNSAP